MPLVDGVFSDQRATFFSMPELAVGLKPFAALCFYAIKAAIICHGVSGSSTVTEQCIFFLRDAEFWIRPA